MDNLDNLFESEQKNNLKGGAGMYDFVDPGDITTEVGMQKAALNIKNMNDQRLKKPAQPPQKIKYQTTVYDDKPVMQNKHPPVLSIPIDKFKDLLYLPQLTMTPYNEYAVTVSNPLCASILNKMYNDKLPLSEFVKEYTNTTLYERLTIINYIKNRMIFKGNGEIEDADNTLAAFIQFIGLHNSTNYTFENSLNAGCVPYKCAYPMAFNNASKEIQLSAKRMHIKLKTYVIPDDLSNNVSDCRFNLGREIYLYTYIKKTVLDKYVSPNFISMILWKRTPNFKHLRWASAKDDIQKKYTTFMENEDKILKKFNVKSGWKEDMLLLLITEEDTYDIKKWMSPEINKNGAVIYMQRTGHHSVNVWKSILFQLIYALKVLMKCNIYINNFDLANIYIKDVTYDFVSIGSWIYKNNDIDYYIPNYGYVLVLDTNYNQHTVSNSLTTHVGKTLDYQYKIYSDTLYKENANIDNKLIKLLNMNLLHNIFTRLSNEPQILYYDIFPFIKSLESYSKIKYTQFNYNINKGHSNISCSKYLHFKNVENTINLSIKKSTEKANELINLKETDDNNILEEAIRTCFKSIKNVKDYDKIKTLRQTYSIFYGMIESAQETEHNNSDLFPIISACISVEQYTKNTKIGSDTSSYYDDIANIAAGISNGVYINSTKTSSYIKIQNIKEISLSITCAVSKIPNTPHDTVDKLKKNIRDSIISAILLFDECDNSDLGNINNYVNVLLETLSDIDNNPVNCLIECFKSILTTLKTNIYKYFVKIISAFFISLFLLVPSILEKLTDTNRPYNFNDPLSVLQLYSTLDNLQIYSSDFYSIIKLLKQFPEFLPSDENTNIYFLTLYNKILLILKNIKINKMVKRFDIQKQIMVDYFREINGEWALFYSIKDKSLFIKYNICENIISINTLLNGVFLQRLNCSRETNTRCYFKLGQIKKSKKELSNNISKHLTDRYLFEKFIEELSEIIQDSFTASIRTLGEFNTSLLDRFPNSHYCTLHLDVNLIERNKELIIFEIIGRMLFKMATSFDDFHYFNKIYIALFYIMHTRNTLLYKIINYKLVPNEYITNPIIQNMLKENDAEQLIFANLFIEHIILLYCRESNAFIMAQPEIFIPNKKRIALTNVTFYKMLFYINSENNAFDLTNFIQNIYISLQSYTNIYEYCVCNNIEYRLFSMSAVPMYDVPRITLADYTARFNIGPPIKFFLDDDTNDLFIQLRDTYNTPISESKSPDILDDGTIILFSPVATVDIIKNKNETSDVYDGLLEEFFNEFMHNRIGTFLYKVEKDNMIDEIIPSNELIKGMLYILKENSELTWCVYYDNVEKSKIGAGVQAATDVKILTKIGKNLIYKNINQNLLRKYVSPELVPQEAVPNRSFDKNTILETYDMNNLNIPDYDLKTTD